PAEIGVGKVKPGTMRALAVSYFSSTEYRSMELSTQGVYRNIIDRFNRDGTAGISYGDLPAASMRREHIIKLMAARPTPDSANGLRRVLRAMMKHAVDIGVRQDDPTATVKAIKIKTDGFHSWSEAEIEQFEAKHPIGSKARLAFTLLLYTGQRRS